MSFGGAENQFKCRFRKSHPVNITGVVPKLQTKDWTAFYRVRTGTDNSVTDCNLRKGSAIDSHKLLIQSNLDMEYSIKAPEIPR